VSPSHLIFLRRHRSQAFETLFLLGCQSLTVEGENRAGPSPAGSDALLSATCCVDGWANLLKGHMVCSGTTKTSGIPRRESMDPRIAEPGQVKAEYQGKMERRMRLFFQKNCSAMPPVTNLSSRLSLGKRLGRFSYTALRTTALRRIATVSDALSRAMLDRFSGQSSTSRAASLKRNARWLQGRPRAAVAPHSRRRIAFRPPPPKILLLQRRSALTRIASPELASACSYAHDKVKTRVRLANRPATLLSCHLIYDNLVGRPHRTLNRHPDLTTNHRLLVARWL
jgi:hypothetical protein